MGLFDLFKKGDKVGKDSAIDSSTVVKSAKNGGKRMPIVMSSQNYHSTLSGMFHKSKSMYSIS